MNSPTTREPSRSGLELLRQALEHPSPVRRGRLTWTALLSVEAAATRRVLTVLHTHVVPRDDLDRATVDEVNRRRYVTAEEVVRAFHRAVMSCPQTLAALAKGTPSPVHGSERPGLAAAVRRPLISAGYHVDEQIIRKVTYAVADAYGQALPTTAKLPPDPVVHPVATADTHAVDHDFFDWRTGEPKLTTDPYLLAVVTAAATGTPVTATGAA